MVQWTLHSPLPRAWFSLRALRLRELSGKFRHGPIITAWVDSSRRMGEMEPWMDENFVKNVFSTVAGEAVNVKVIRDRASG